MDADGRLGCEEFVLAMHLCEQAAAGHPTPAKLPLDMIPPSFRKTTRSLSRTASISSQGSAPQEVDPASTLLQSMYKYYYFHTEDEQKIRFLENVILSENFLEKVLFHISLPRYSNIPFIFINLPTLSKNYQLKFS